MWPVSSLSTPALRRYEVNYIREVVQEGKVSIHYVRTEDSMGKRFLSKRRPRVFRRAGHGFQDLAKHHRLE